MTERVVVIGHGMVAGRFLIELDGRQLDAEVTVPGDEPHPAYNRLLLAEAIRGRYDLDDLLLPASAGVRVERSRSAVAIGPPGHRVIGDTGAASPGAAIAVAVRGMGRGCLAFETDEPAGKALIVSGSDTGERGALLIEQSKNQKP